MSEIVERVARAIAMEIFGEWNPHESHLHATGSGQSLDAARAAIEAMREPTEAMQRAGHWKRTEPLDGKPIPGIDEIWSVMLDAALKAD